MSELKGRVALVTGGARGLGAAAAKALAGKGAKVVVSDVRDGEESAAAVGGAYVKHDVTSEDDWIAAVAFAKERFGGLDILVNNAGVFWIKPTALETLEGFRKMQQVNVEGGSDEQAVALRDAMRVLFPEAVALVSAARQGFMRE